MQKLKFDPQLCLSCNTYSCLTKCIYLNYSFDSAKEEMRKIALGEYSRVLEECYACCGCEEYCEYNNHPFFIMAEMMESLGVKRADDAIREDLLQRLAAEGEFIPKRTGGKFVHICIFPEVKEMIKGKLFEGYEIVRGRHVFCNTLYLRYGMISVTKERAGRTIENLKKLNADEIVLYHDECYVFYKSFAEAYGIEVPFNFVHLFDHLYRKLKEMDVKELGLKVAYHRNCTNRFNPETDRILDRIFELIGVERVEREYDRERAICCGGLFFLEKRSEKAEELQKKILEDISSTNATHVVFNCPFCYTALAEKVRTAGKTPIMVSELCKMAIGEEPVKPCSRLPNAFGSIH